MYLAVCCYFTCCYVWRPPCNFFSPTSLVRPPGLTEIIKFVKPAPIDQEVTKKAKKQQGGGKKKKQEGADQNLPNAMESMSVNES